MRVTELKEAFLFNTSPKLPGKLIAYVGDADDAAVEGVCLSCPKCELPVVVYFRGRGAAVGETMDKLSLAKPVRCECGWMAVVQNGELIEAH